MHTITFLPQRRDDLTLDGLAWAGDVLTINGAALDLAVIPEGATLPGSAVDHALVAGEITRAGGALSVTLILPLGANPSTAAQFPGPVTTGDGPVPIPVTDDTPTEEAPA